jgi:hypothetical protein
VPQHRPLKSLDVADSDDCIVLYGYPSGGGKVRNLHRKGRDGTIVWTAELPEVDGADAYVAVSLDRGALIAHSWSCFRVVIDPDSGRILESEFTK